jgi:hypothetical protein
MKAPIWWDESDVEMRKGWHPGLVGSCVRGRTIGMESVCGWSGTDGENIPAPLGLLCTDAALCEAGGQRQRSGRTTSRFLPFYRKIGAAATSRLMFPRTYSGANS